MQLSMELLIQYTNVSNKVKYDTILVSRWIHGRANVVTVLLWLT